MEISEYRQHILGELAEVRKHNETWIKTHLHHYGHYYNVPPPYDGDADYKHIIIKHPLEEIQKFQHDKKPVFTNVETKPHRPEKQYSDVEGF